MACGARGVASVPVCVAYASFMHGACACAWACRVVSGFVYAETRVQSVATVNSSRECLSLGRPVHVRREHANGTSVLQ